MTPGVLAAVLAAPFVGSFLGVVIDRLPHGRPLLLARSTCDTCGMTLAPRDLIPLLSWLMRGGRCRCGRARLRAFYPLIELGALGVALWAAAVLSGWLYFVTCALGWALLALAVIDQRHEVLPDILTLPLIPAGLALAYALDPAKLTAHAIGALAGWAAFSLIAWIYKGLRGREGLGMGDAKLLAGAGAWLGWAALPSVVLIAATAALAQALACPLAGKPLEAASRMPFGPHLAVGFWLVWLYGPIGFA